MRSRFLTLAFIGCTGSVVVAVGCGSSDGSIATQRSSAAVSKGRADVCHRTESGSVLRLTVDEHALPAHLDHGDHLPFDVWPDADGDGYGDATAIATSVCEAAPGQVTNASDCADHDAGIHPGGEETCGNGKDDDCNGMVDEKCIDVWPDGDGDGYGDAKSTPISVHVPEKGQVTNGGDCDDKNGKVYPGAPEVCFNGIDEDCNGKVDDCPVPPPPKSCDPKVDKGCFFVWPDKDFDGWGDASAAPVGVYVIGPAQVTNNGDCNDGSPLIHPYATEICGDGADTNCDGTVDEGCKPPPVCTTPTIPSGTCACYCGVMSKSWCVDSFGWKWDDVNSICLTPFSDAATCDYLQKKHQGDGSGSSVYNLGVTCTVGN